MAIVYRNFPTVTGGYDDMEFTITVAREPGNNGRTYWAHQWAFSGSSEPGYVGLQSVTGDTKILNFSIWKATAWRDATGANCRLFTHEGSGVQCSINYAWQEGVTYKIRVARAGTDGWAASIVNTATGVRTPVATIVVPATYGGLSGPTEWVENFAQGAEQLSSCSAVPTAIAVYGVPTANGGTVRPTSSGTVTYGNCAAVAKSVCMTDQVCTLSANPLPAFQSKQLKSIVNMYCLDLLGGGTSVGLYYCSANANQVFSHDDEYRIHRVSNPAQCLSVAGDDKVIAEACGNVAKQQWLKVARTNTYFNAGTAKCFEATGTGGIESLVRVAPCQGTRFQSVFAAP